MSTARRGYIYLVAAISLQALAWAAVYLLRNLLAWGTPSRDAVALQAAIILVSLPVYVAHWLWAGRLVARDPAERCAGLRWLYLYGVLALFVVPIITNAVGLLGLALARWPLDVLPALTQPMTLHGDPLVLLTVTRNAAAILVLGALWVYHWLVARRDAALAPVQGDAAALRRLYLLGASLLGGTLAVVGANRVLRWSLYQVGDNPALAGPSTLELASESARLLVGLAAWVLAWRAAQRLRRDGGPGEAASTLRLFYLYLVVVLSALTVVTNLALVLTGLFRAWLALPARGDLRGPLPVIIVVGVVWAYHAGVLRAEAALAEGAGRAAVRRLYTYLVAAVGLAASVVGLTSLLALLARGASAGGFGLAEKEQLAWSAAVLLAGLPVWAWAWRRAQAWAIGAGNAGAAERAATTRRTYLYVGLLAGAVMVLVAVVYLVYRQLAVVLGAPPPADLAVRQARALAMTLVGGLLWLYHAYVIRSDSRVGRVDRAAALAALRPLLVDPGDGSWSAAVRAALAQLLPGVDVPVVMATAGVGPAAELELAPATAVRVAGVVVAPADFLALPATSAPAAELTAALVASPARRLLVPAVGGAVDWVGVAPLSSEAAARQVAVALRQMAEGEPVRPEAPISALTVLGWLAAAVVMFVLGMFLLTEVLGGPG